MAAVLGFPEVEAVIRALERAHIVGRRGYGPRKLIPVVLVKLFYVTPTWAAALDLIADNPVLTAVCGCAHPDELPSSDAVYRFLAKERQHPWRRELTLAVQSAIRALDPSYGKVAAADSTDLPAYANGQRYIRQGGPARQRYADPDASWGHRGSVSTRKGGGFYGYKPHAIVDAKRELPLGLVTRTASESEIAQVERWLASAADQGFDPKTVILDKGYDYAPVYQSCHRRRIRLVCPLRSPDKLRDAHRVPICSHNGHEHRWEYAGTDLKRRATKWRCPFGRCRPASIWIPLDRFHPAIPRETKRSRTLYAQRGVVERFWSRLKKEWGLLELRVRRLDRVAQHVDLVVLAYLLFDLAKLRAP